MGRSTQGVTLINLGEGEKLAGWSASSRATTTNGATAAGNGRQRRGHGDERRAAAPRRRGAPARTVHDVARLQLQRRPGMLPSRGARAGGDEMLDWHGSGMSVMEMSHRGKEFIAIAAEAEADLRELLGIPSNYKVLFLQGGATLQFAMVPMNLLRGKGRRRLRQHRRVVEEGDRRRREVLRGERRRELRGPQLHLRAATGEWRSTRRRPTCTICSNETIGGVEFHWIPDTGEVPLVADMSSHILSRPLDVSRFGLIYAGAQKNIGPAGLTIVIVRDDLLGQARCRSRRVMDYGAGRADSMLNTPPTYAIYIAGLVFKWLKGRAASRRWRAQPRQGEAALRLPRRRPSSITPVAKADRSRMNVPFTLRDDEARRAFLEGGRGAG
jgi:phosphoserine aminotransferase